MKFFLKVKQTHHFLNNYFKEGESMIIAELDIANKFNNFFFFTNIGNDLASK